MKIKTLVAGVGKSHLTKLLFQAVYKYLNTRAGDDFHQIRAILVASTGKAAYNIQGKQQQWYQPKGVEKGNKGKSKGAHNKGKGKAVFVVIATLIK